MIELYNCDNLELMATLRNESIDVICIDPPYLYLKNQKLERTFDERLFFKECARILTNDGFIVMFGRGDSFYRWNQLLNNLIQYKEGSVKYGYKVYDEDGLVVNIHKFKDNIFTFKEEIVWDKSYSSSPLMNISRVHETISVFCKGVKGVNKVKIPYIEMRSENINDIIQDVKRLRSVFKNTKSLNAVLNYLEDGKISYEGDYVNSTTITNGKRRIDRCVAAFSQMEKGLNEKTIIKQVRDHYTSIHPTQKPVRLIERLLALVIPNKPRHLITVADFFGGSMSTMEAVHNMGMNGIASEIDEEYFIDGKERIDNLQPVQQKMFA